MRFVDLIEKKKDGQALTTEEIQYWISGYVNGTIPDYQVSALCMAICFKGMNDREITDLTRCMRDSGEKIDLSDIPGVKIDKHSTGGVGDKTSLALIPMVAACGAKVAKMSGRGLGFTGGTLDKLESIKGFNISLTDEQFHQQVKDIGLAIIGQTANIDPADKKLYALRDVTGTVQSIPLIASSIMSKKLASGADTILLDVKYGNGAFMHTPENAERLAREMIRIGRDCGKDTRAMITSMEEPLGNAVGNAVEVKEAIATLNGNGPQDFVELCRTAGSIILVQAKIAKDRNEALAMLDEKIRSGAALQKLKDMVQAQGGDIQQIDHPELLPTASSIIPVKAERSGYIHDLAAMSIGNLAMRLGAGRATKDDQIDHAAGIVLCHKVGAYVKQGDTLAYVHTNRPLTQDWVDEFLHTVVIKDEKPVEKRLIYKVID